MGIEGRVESRKLISRGLRLNIESSNGKGLISQELKLVLDASCGRRTIVRAAFGVWGGVGGQRARESSPEKMWSMREMYQ